MNSAHFFTATRIILAPFFLILYFLPQYTALPKSQLLIVLILLFIYMEFTDFLDGYFARKYNQVSNFGKVFDPFADVIANITVLLAFMLSGYVPLFVFVIILYREMGILFLRMLARGNGVTIGAKKGGKLKTICYIIAEGFSLFIEMFNTFFIPGASLLAGMVFVNKLLYCIAALLSILSFIDYVTSYRNNLRTK